MLELRLPPPEDVDEAHLARVRDLIAQVLDIGTARGNRAGNQAIIDALGLNVRLERDEAYCGEALHYHLGLLYAHVGDAERAARHFEESKTYPSDGGNAVFADHQHDSGELRRQQQAAAVRGIPSIILAALPRSASASLTQTIARSLDMPIMRVSCGRFPDFSIVPRWLNAFTPGGAILHDHFGASPFNLATLRGGNVREVFVRARDPRPAAASHVRLSDSKHATVGRENFEGRVISLYEEAFVPWLMRWIAVAVDPAADVQVRWLLQPQAAIGAAAHEIIARLAAHYPTLERYSETPMREIKANFVIGDEEAWRTTISAAGQERLWHATPDAVRELLALRP
jgi:hypothetical protein